MQGILLVKADLVGLFNIIFYVQCFKRMDIDHTKYCILLPKEWHQYDSGLYVYLHIKAKIKKKICKVIYISLFCIICHR